MASYQCDRCLKQFSSYYNVRRHKADHCAYAKIDDNASMDGGGSSYSDEQSVDSFPDEESVTETEEDENSENSGDDDEIKEEIDPWATMIDDAKATVRPEYDEFMKTLQMDGQEEKCEAKCEECEAKCEECEAKCEAKCENCEAKCEKCEAKCEAKCEKYEDA
ncbi:guanylyl cyclase [Paramuricea clavata]|uniref:Guanylyl cyclase n=1 Tax=Paramuricea clavata TaxID=317549 RepID=A0A7D9I840_PARCT|nr:guanylyl cyclase [Paramuricea clavata]